MILAVESHLNVDSMMKLVLSFQPYCAVVDYDELLVLVPLLGENNSACCFWEQSYT